MAHVMLKNSWKMILFTSSKQRQGERPPVVGESVETAALRPGIRADGSGPASGARRHRTCRSHLQDDSLQTDQDRTVIERKLTLVRLNFSSDHPLEALFAHAVRCLAPPQILQPEWRGIGGGVASYIEMSRFYM